MQDVSLKFMFGWLIVISVTYAFCGYIYSTSLETPTFEAGETPEGWIDIAKAGFQWLIDGLIGIFRVFFFALPEMPVVVTIVINLIVQPINIIWFLGIYPLIKDIVTIAIEFGKLVASWIDSIIPF